MTRSTGGSVRRHPERDLWQARFTGADGRRHSIYGRTRKEAQERLRAALTASDHGIRPVSQRLTVRAFLEDWLETMVARRCRPRTVESYANLSRLYLIPALGHGPLAKLEPEDVGRLVVTLSKGPLSPTTVRAVYSTLRTALNDALRLGRVHRNVATLVDPPAKAHHDRQPLTRAQVRAFLEGIQGDRFEALYVTAIGTGMRQGELLALRWSDVDVERGTLTVRHTLQRFSRTLAPTKTARSQRTLRLPRTVLAALVEHRSRQPVRALSGLVFTAAGGQPLASTNVTAYLQRHLARLGLPHQRFHDLRNAAATLMLEDGADLAEVSRMLGHSSVAVTADIYVAWTKVMQERVAERMDGILGG
ncbi:MAG: tyrosine-type recombinase/integrase [Candidatus Limnocylindria bacterium]